MPTIRRRDRGLVAGRERDVTCEFGRDDVTVRIEDVGTFAVGGGGGTVEIVAEHPGAPGELVDEALLGPPLLLALALQDVSCLHAGAVADEEGAIAWLGPSGAGKSTLAAFFDAEVGGWDRCADDLLPVGETAGGVRALPHFPQLKLPPGAQWRGGRPERLALRAVYVLGRSESGVRVEPIKAGDAVVEMLQQTAVWSLFPPDLAERHLALCARIAEAVPVSRLVYPRRFEDLPEVAVAIEADLQRSG